jgi:NADPH:quinone reductase-like Zn-dependent oxidoreductase
MKAAVNARYGSPDVLEIRQVHKPEPKAGEVLIRVHATTVSRTDCGMRRPHPQFVRLFAGLLRPKRTILGMDFAGVVEAVGAGVASFKPGDRVFGLSPDVYGAHAEYLCLPETAAMAVMPVGVAFGEAVVCEGAWYADTHPHLQRIRRYRHRCRAAREVLWRQGHRGRRDAALGPRQRSRCCPRC